MTEHPTTEPIGPHKFDVPALAVDETWHLNLRQEERNGRKGWYRPYLPMDFLQVTNESSERLLLEYNNTTEDIVVGSSVESYDDTAVEYVSVTNIGSAATSSDDVVVAIEKTPYGADDQARDQATMSPLRKVAKNLTGL